MPRHIQVFRSFVRIVLAGVFLMVSARTVHAQALNSFRFDNFQTGSPKIAGQLFPITISALDMNSDVLTGFSGIATLTDDTGTIYPTQTTNFTNGQWTGMVYITGANPANRITVANGGVVTSSATFIVNPDNRIRFLTISGGNYQSGTVGTLLPQALTVRAVDSYANPIPNLGINFTVTSAPPNAVNYGLSSPGGTTNNAGQVSTTLTLGRKAGSYIVGASLNSGIVGNNVVFYETATPTNLISISITPPVTVITAGSYIPFRAAGYDQYLNEITLPSVTWSVQNGGGTIDATGVFYAGNVLGNFSNTVKATSGSVGASASVNIVDIWTGVAGGSGTGNGSGNGNGNGNPTSTGTPSAQIAPTPTPAPNPGVLYDVQIEPDVITALKNAQIPVVAQGVDFFGNPVSGVSYGFQVTGNLGTLTQTGANSVLLTASENGIGTVTITATQGNVARVAKVVGSVGTGMNRRLVIEDIASPQKVGEPFTISIAAKDSLNNFITDYQGPLVLADSTGTLDPAVVQPSNTGIWYVQAIINAANPEVSVTAAGDGMVGVSNIFEVQGSPKKSELAPGIGGGAGGLGSVLGASVSAKIDEILKAKNLDKYAVVRFIGAGLAAGFGILGASVGGGLMASKGLEAIGRNPFAKSRLQLNLYVSLIVFIAAASLAVFASTLIVK